MRPPGVGHRRQSSLEVEVHFKSSGGPAGENRRVRMLPATARVVAAALGLAGLLAARPAAQIPPLREPVTRGAVEALAAGKLLVAARRLPDPNFGKTVILLVDANDDGAVGLVLNRRSGVTLAKVFPHLTP